MLTLFYSPHMTNVDNEAGRASGHADVPLSALGRQQAQELGQHQERLQPGLFGQAPRFNVHPRIGSANHGAQQS